MHFQRLIFLWGFAVSLGLGWAADNARGSESTDQSVACEDPLKAAQAGTRYARAQAVLSDSKMPLSQLEAAWADMKALTELPASGKFSLKDEILNFLAESYASINSRIRAQAGDFLIQNRRDEDLKTLLMSFNLCASADESEPCSPAKLAAFRGVLKKWGQAVGWKAEDLRTAAKDSAQAQVAKILSEDAAAAQSESTAQATAPSAEPEAPVWSLEDEESLAKLIQGEVRNAYSDVPKRFNSAIYETFYTPSLETDRENVTHLREMMFPHDYDWKTGGIEVPEEVFDEALVGDLNLQQQGALRVLAIAGSIMKNYLPVLKKEIARVLQEHLGDKAKEHPLVTRFDGYSSQRAYGVFAWVWRQSEDAHPDPMIKELWASIRPVLAYAGIYERLLEIAVNGISKDSDLSPVLPLDAEVMKQFLRSSECDKGIVDVVASNPDTSATLKSKLFQMR